MYTIDTRDKIMKNIFSNNNKAFTLSEVLITLAIIGVVAAITLPTIIANYNEQDKISKIRKNYATLNNALSLSIVNGGDDIYDVAANDFKTVESYFNNYLKDKLLVTKVCYNKAGCWNKGDTKNLNGTNVYYNRKGVGVGADIITAVLTDGTFINVDVYGSASIWKYFGTKVENNGLVIFFDINGGKKPNTVGKDIFPLIYTSKGIKPVYSDKTKAEIDKDCSKTGTGYSCIRKYLKGAKSM